MIKKSLCISVVLLILFELFIRISNIQWDTSQNDKSANLISAQTFIYNLPNEQVVNDTLIIGSSIARKLVADSLGSHFFNLAFNGWSSYDGLELIKLTHKTPACLLIEMNIIGDQVVQQDVLNSLSPVSYYADELLKSLQLQNQPVGLAIGYFKNTLKSRMEELKKKKRDNLELYKYNLQMQKDKLMDALPDSVLAVKFGVLKDLIDTFKNQHIDIVFFEAPLDPALENTTTVLTLRKYFHRYFPDNEFKYIPNPQVNDFIYSDGIHLSVESAIAYTLYLKKEIAIECQQKQPVAQPVANR